MKESETAIYKVLQQTMATAIDPEAYLKRIGYAGERAPTFDTLRSIHARHTAAIAFENLNPLMGWPVPLDVESLQQKLVRDGRGGYCFEHNLLLKQILDVLGFRTTGLAARVLWNVPEGIVFSRSHMLLLVDLDEVPYIVDAGFGGRTPTGPLRLVPGIEQVTPHEPFRLIRSNQEFVMQVKIRGDWKALYRFDLQEQLLPDYVVSNWYIATHPDSPFVTELRVSRPAPGRRYTLLNNQLTVHHLNGSTEQRLLTSIAEMRDTLENVFCIALPDVPELDSVLTRLTA